MREIKFRAWSKSRKEMREVTDDWFIGDLKQKGFVVMQYTGLKDKNGKEIWEGDVVCYVVDEVVENIGGYDRTEPEGHLGKVEFANGAFWVNGKEYAFYQYGEQMFMWSELEVIGNIYENPELLST